MAKDRSLYCTSKRELYMELDKFLSKRDMPIDAKSFAPNTFITRDGSSFNVLFWSTRIFTIDENFNITLNSGGHMTMTTKQRINWLLPRNIRLFQKNYDWYLTVNGEKVDFFDGITI